MVLELQVPSGTTPLVLRQQFAGRTFQIKMYWNGVWECWMYELYDVNGTLLVGATPMVTGVRDIVGYAQVDFPGRLVVVAPDRVINSAVPKDGWSNGWKLIWTDIP